MKHSSSSTTDPFFHEADFRLFQDSIDPIIITDLPGNIIMANQRATQLFDLRPEALVGSRIGHLHQNPDLLPDFSVLPDNSTERFDSIIQLSAENRLLYVEVHAHRYALGDRHIVQWIHHDITRQTELDQMREDQAAMLVHDLRSPLGNVISSLELVRGELETNYNSVLYSMVDIAIRSSYYLQALVDSLLDISRLQAGRPLENRELVDIETVVEFVSAVQAPEFEQRNVTLKSEIDPNVKYVLAESNILRRILLNLVSNALKYSQSGQSVVIKIDNVEDGNEVKFSVIDQGQGVPEPFHEIVFEKYRSVEDQSPSAGLGLGLAFCRLAVEAHGGRIWVEDAPGGGACFAFTIPGNQIS